MPNQHSSYPNQQTTPIQLILTKLDLKFAQITTIKDQLTHHLKNNDTFSNPHHNQTRHIIAKYIKQQLLGYINKMLTQNHQANMHTIAQIKNRYEQELQNRSQYYQAQIDQLRDQIRRQYKVIGLMKQQVEDLMVLIKQQKLDQGYYMPECERRNPPSLTSEDRERPNTFDEQTSFPSNSYEQRKENQNSSRSSSVNITSTSRDRRFSLELDIIEQETQRTLLSSDRSHQNYNHLDAQKTGHRRTTSIDSNIPYQQKGQNQFHHSNTTSFIRIEAEENNYCAESVQKNDIQQQQQNSEWKNGYGMSKEKKDEQQQFYEQDLSPMCQSQNQIAISQDRPRTIGNNNNKTVTDFNAQQKQPASSHLQSIFFPEEESAGDNNRQCMLFGAKPQMQKHSLTQNCNIEGSSPHQMSQVSKSLANSKVSYDDDEAQYSLTDGNCQKYLSIQYNKKTITKKAFNTQQSDDNQGNMSQSKQKVFAKKFIKSSAKKQTQQSKLIDITNQDLDSKSSVEASDSASKPKTKQFLQQFRKTFNKCLNSMQVAKKNSTKQMSKGSQSLTLSPNNITFGRMQTPDVRSQRDRDIPSQQKLGQHLKAVDMMFKELENSNKFTIGSKKLELKYEGDRKNGNRHGNGVLYYSNGLCYEGEFKDGVRHGYGILKFNHIQIYNGDWACDEMEGQGKIRNCAIINKKKSACSSQSALGKWISYSGQFKNSRFEGSGTLYLQGGEKFVGKFSGGVASGDGAIYRKNGQVEQGIWKNNILLERESSRNYENTINI